MNTKSSPTKRVSPKTSVDLTEPTDVNLISITYSNKIDKIVQFIERSPEYSILPVRDVRLYSLLHIACLNNQINICQLLFTHAKRLNATPAEIKEWVNAKTDEGFSAIHFASFKGNIELVRLLEINGADIHCRNHQGLSVIHIAAQGDQPVSIAYFQKKGLSIHEKDKKGSTPLHWAAFLGMENATTYLTTWGCSPNVTDAESGLTPLHLAVISGNPRVVRRLLIKGADKTMKNNEGKTPIQLARENEYENIVQILQDKNKLLTYLNIKPNLQKNRSRFSLMMFIVMYIVAIGGNVFLIFPYLEHLIWVILFGIVTGCTLLSFLLVWLSNPGYIKNQNKGEILHLLLNNDPHLVCPECVIVKPLRSKHCEYCNSCVAVYDHHCPWINNCVGARNHAYFITFTISTLVAIVYLCILGATHISSDTASYEYFPFFHFSNQSLVHTFKYVICGIDIIAALVFVIPLFALNYVQVGNFFVGKTTSERFGFNVSRDNINQSMNQSLSSSRIEQGYVKITKEPHYQFMQAVANCKLMCCGNKEDQRYNLKLIEVSNHQSSSNLDKSSLIMSP